ncbi:hypothetical protein DFH07DRAFT_967879 [Mycena maculata]|uniref:Uncharacterized protein n=1 Tax=Mycena maculata TaxID=230809 RepID=A0AAD7I2Q2_9AGAR|nr:hypothetical protein DFH07DRAFT_967879 [Mycena maculata]
MSNEPTNPYNQAAPQAVRGIKRAVQHSQGIPTMRAVKSGSSEHVTTTRIYVPANVAGRSLERVFTTRTYVPANVSGRKTSSSFTQPMGPPPIQGSRLAYKQSPARAAPDSRAFGASNSTRRAMGMTASSISAPTPLKRAQQDKPYWIAEDKAFRASQRRFVAMSVGAPAFPKRIQNVTEKEYGTNNENIREEYEVNHTRYVGRKAARKTEVQEDPSDDEKSESSPSESSDSDDSDDWESIPESDKESETEKTGDSGNESDDSVELMEFRPVRPPVIEILDDTPPASPVHTPRPSPPPSVPHAEIINAIERLVLPATSMQARKRLPFLTRNLRRGFLNYCRVRGVSTTPDDEVPPLTVIFKLSDSELPPHEEHVSCYECPLCRLHLPFPTREMLQVHLDQDHREVCISWAKTDNQENWRFLELLLTSRDTSLTDRKSPGRPTEADLTIIPPSPFGPTARFPFLPAKSEYGGPDLYYSTRFGGPKIYDLLGTLPMEPYGALAWSVLDREEEIFESDDIPDEHKVMHALWARWIFFKRNFFVANYVEGILYFIKDYWKMIRLAAGWDALRYWLLLLMTGRFLTTGHEIVKILKYYEELCREDA